VAVSPPRLAAAPTQTLTNVTVCPDGQVKPTSAAVRGDTVSEPTTLPFLAAVKVPILLSGPVTDVLFDADGFFPPPLTHSYVTTSLPAQLIVSTEPDSSLPP
jgi:hypothetical protein